MKKPLYFLLLLALQCASLPLVAQGAPWEDKDSLVLPGTLKEIEEIIEEEIIRNLQETHLGEAPEYAAESCKQIGEVKPYADSGYYWIRKSSGPIEVYCELHGDDKFDRSGGWMRIAHVDMTDSSAQCPPGMKYTVIEEKRLCQRPPENIPGCSSSIFSVQDLNYTKLCGKVVGYPNRWPNGFGPSYYDAPGIEGVYLDGVSITHGSPRQHVFSLAAGNSYNSEDTACPCINTGTTFTGQVADFVGENYYCEKNAQGGYEPKYYFDDPLWDGAGCGGTYTCCDRGGPWFCAELDNTSDDNIEVRICANNGDGGDDIVIEDIELYVQ